MNKSEKFVGTPSEIIQFLQNDTYADPDALYELQVHKVKRSNEANSLMWECLQRMAYALDTDKWTLYLQELKKYGKFSYVLVKPKAVDAMKAQWREIEEVGEVDVNGQKAVQLLCYYGSSLYNTTEFAKLLDGIISDMRDIGLQPPPDKETKALLEEMERREREKINSN